MEKSNPTSSFAENLKDHDRGGFGGFFYSSSNSSNSSSSSREYECGNFDFFYSFRSKNGTPVPDFKNKRFYFSPPFLPSSSITIGRHHHRPVSVLLLINSQQKKYRIYKWHKESTLERVMGHLRALRLPFDQKIIGISRIRYPMSYLVTFRFVSDLHQPSSPSSPLPIGRL